MANFPKSAVIVGGSLAGLMHGLILKRHGTNVTILEQEPATTRSSHNAGIGFGPQTEELLRDYCDLSGLEGYYAPAVKTRLALRKKAKFKEINVVRHLTSWVLLYRILRANFDGLGSSTIPRPPPPRKNDGNAEYRSGQRVISLEYQAPDSTVTVYFVDAATGKESSLTTELLIGADGVNSVVRDLVQRQTSQRKEYAGYVAWRGTVPDDAVSEATKQYFSDRTCANILHRSSIITYMIPSDDHNGSGTARRLINFVWYYNVAPGSTTMIEVFTDSTGHQHQNTVPSGLVKPEVWTKVKKTMLDRMAEPFVELIGTCDISRVFVTKVNDVVCSDSASFYNGKVLLVGDALVAFRPHFAVATEQAAGHSLGLTKVWEGEKSLHEWKKEVTAYGKRTWLASRVLGEFGQGTWFSFLRTVFAYLVLLIQLKLGRG
ncbi:zeaxanthin epoxidase, chloroplastic [Triangularia verruculosa]|uniref:Zeaxanthin epoxidase, chloroplastic n=1 Tax=Triangularia verruculosa TaxID=2587418 RepID=A0AAN6XIB4_9PEZI|nr:zeaxanthin epoxidase, chloroplastic [Triangularia verruculosa]